MHCHTALGQWAVQLPQCTASLRGGSGQWNSCNALPHCLGAVGSGTLAMRGPTSWPHGESYPGGGHCLKSGTPAMHCHNAWGQWAVELLQCTATLPGGCGQWNSCHARAHQLGGRGVLPKRRSLLKERKSCNALPHCLGAGGQWSSVVLCCVVLCRVVLCCVVLCCVVLCCVTLCCVPCPVDAQISVSLASAPALLPLPHPPAHAPMSPPSDPPTSPSNCPKSAGGPP